MNTWLRPCAITMVAFLLAGCFEITARHDINLYGDSDNGIYRIRFDNFTYSMISSDQGWSDFMGNLRRFSNPRIRNSGDYVYIEDTSGLSAMEHFYDDYRCSRNADGRTADCRYVFNFSDGNNAPGWKINWEVSLRPDTRVISSNHHRERTQSGYRHLYWNYEYSRHTGGRVDFTVRVPVAR